MDEDASSIIVDMKQLEMELQQLTKDIATRQQRLQQIQVEADRINKEGISLDGQRQMLDKLLKHFIKAKKMEEVKGK